MKRLAALVLAALMILGMTACGQKKDESKSKLDQIKEAGVLVVGTSADYSPFEFHTQVDGQDTIVGIDISICQYIADQLGVQLAQSVADVLSFLLTLVMMRRVFRNLQAEENAAMLLRHQRTSEPYAAENAPENPETT